MVPMLWLNQIIFLVNIKLMYVTAYINEHEFDFFNSYYNDISYIYICFLKWERPLLNVFFKRRDYAFVFLEHIAIYKKKSQSYSWKLETGKNSKSCLYIHMTSQEVSILRLQ